MSSSRKGSKSGSRRGSKSSKGSARRNANSIVTKTSTDIQAQGWLNKQGHVFKTWRSRFFRLRRDGRLEYFKDDKASVPLDTIPLINGKLEDVKSTARSHSFIIHCTDKKKPRYILQASSSTAKQEWMSELSVFCSLMNKTLDLQPEDERDPLENALVTFDAAVKARPIQHDGVHKGLTIVYGMVLELEKETTFADSPDLSYTDLETLLEVGVRMGALALASYVATNDGDGRVMRLLGNFIAHNCRYNLARYKKWTSKEHSHLPHLSAAAPMLLLRTFEDANLAATLVPEDVEFLTVYEQVCKAVSKDSLNKETAKLAKTLAGEIPALIAWAPSQKENPQLRAFGYLTVHGKKLFGSGWSRKFFALYPDRLDWFDKPKSRKPTGSVALSKIVKLTDGEPLEDRPFTFDIQLEDNHVVHLDAVVSEFKGFWIGALVGAISAADGGKKSGSSSSSSRPPAAKPDSSRVDIPNLAHSTRPPMVGSMKAEMAAMEAMGSPSIKK